jgi:hypothetical protein
MRGGMDSGADPVPNPLTVPRRQEYTSDEVPARGARTGVVPMTKTRHLRLLGTLTAAAALAVSTGPAMASAAQPSGASAYTCSGGEIPSGDYTSITVTGMCSVAPDAVITVVGNINVAAGAMFDAQSAPSTITVGHNVTAGTGSLLGLGCQPPSYTGNSAHECVTDPAGISHITIHGNVTATDADTVALNGITVDRNVTLTGGGSFIPWSVKNNMIGGNLTMSGQTTEWLGVLFNHVAGNATLTNITVTEDHPDASRAVFVVRNTIGRNLTCMGLGPNISGGFFPGSVNVVGGRANGQCAALV